MSFASGIHCAFGFAKCPQNIVLGSKFTKRIFRYSSSIGGFTALSGKSSIRLSYSLLTTDLPKVFSINAKVYRRRFFSTNDNSNGDDRHVKIKKIYVRSPFRWLDVKVKVFLLKSYFDQEFEESEFLQGAKQAICVVTRLISEEDFKALAGMMSEKATEDSRELCKSVSDIAALKVTDADIDNISLSNLGFEYDGKGRKWADILVTCHCIDDNQIPEGVKNVGIIGFPSQRIFNFSFVREFTPGVATNWIIDRIAYTKTFSDAL